MKNGERPARAFPCFQSLLLSPHRQLRRIRSSPSMNPGRGTSSAATQFNFAITCPSSSTSTKPMTSPCAIGASTLSGSYTDSDKPLCCPFFSSIESPLPSASGTLSALPPRTSTFCPSKSPLFAITTRRYVAKP